MQFQKQFLKTHKQVELSKIRLKSDFFLPPPTPRQQGKSKDFSTEQCVQGYVRTHRKQEVICSLPIFHAKRLHPSSHSILHIFCSSSSFCYRKTACRDKKKRAVKDLTSVFLTTSTMLFSLSSLNEVSCT